MDELIGRYVFDIAGTTRSIAGVDEAGVDPFDEAHPANTDACPA